MTEVKSRGDSARSHVPAAPPRALPVATFILALASSAELGSTFIQGDEELFGCGSALHNR